MDSSDSFSEPGRDMDSGISDANAEFSDANRTTVEGDFAQKSEPPTTSESAANTDPFAFDQAASEPFVGQWNQLVSRTNWDKGQIIYEWRQALIDASAPATTYSDEAWAQLVGSVTGQHVGRLRRVYQRFSESQESYPGLFWTHFQAALDWDDAEMWLEGAVKESWSVSKMRNQRWETLGSLPEQRPSEEDVVAADLDEDFEPALQEQPETAPQNFDESTAGPRTEKPDFGEEEQHFEGGDVDPSGASVYAGEVDNAIEFVRPFENLKDLPEDLAEAFESFKLSIILHKSAGWVEVSSEEILASLDALKALVDAPSGDQ